LKFDRLGLLRCFLYPDTKTRGELYLSFNSFFDNELGKSYVFIFESAYFLVRFPNFLTIIPKKPILYKMYLRLFFAKRFYKRALLKKPRSPFFLSVKNSLFSRRWNNTDLRWLYFWYTTKYAKAFRVRSVRFSRKNLREWSRRASCVWFFMIWNFLCNRIYLRDVKKAFP